MNWKCEFCESTNPESQDYCSECEYSGCTKDNHKCQKYNDPEWISEKMFGEYND